MLYYNVPWGWWNFSYTVIPGHVTIAWDKAL